MNEDWISREQALTAERDQLRAEVERLREDAGRYLFLRDKLPFVKVELDSVAQDEEKNIIINFRCFSSFSQLPGCLPLKWTDDSLKRIDAAIDSARKEAKP